MPNPSWVPLIGSGFDSLAQQGQYWSGFNARQDEANIARQNAAEQNVNQYLFRQNEMDRQDAARQDLIAAQERAQATAEALASAKEARYAAQRSKEFDVGTALEKERIASQDRRYTFERDEKKRLEDTAKQELENFGKNHAQVTRKAAQEYADMSEKYQSAESALMSFGQQKLGELNNPHLTYDSRSHQIVPLDRRMPPTDPKVVTAMQKANEDIAKEMGNFAGLRDEYLAAKTAFQTAQAPAIKMGFSVDDRGNLYHALLDKKFGVPDMVSAGQGVRLMPGQQGWTPPTAPAGPSKTPAPVAAAAPTDSGSPIWDSAAKAAMTVAPVTMPFVAARELYNRFTRPASSAPTPATMPAPTPGSPPAATNEPAADAGRFTFNAPAGQAPMPPALVAAGRVSFGGAPAPPPDAAPAKPQFPPAPPPEQRVIGQIYSIPSGPLAGHLMRWTKDWSGQLTWQQYDPADEAVKNWLGRKASAVGQFLKYNFTPQPGSIGARQLGM